MKVVLVSSEGARIVVTAEECSLIADGCRDASTLENPSVSGDLARVFEALSAVLPFVYVKTDK